MQREHPDIPFERYADDAICHCRSEAQALELRRALEQRFAECRLRLHPQKTKILYCKDANRPGENPAHTFDFLGYTFRPRLASNRIGKRFVSFLPAVSSTAAKRMRRSVRRWRLHRRNDLELQDIASWVRPVQFWESLGLRCPALLAYLKAYDSVAEARSAIGGYFGFYNTRRPHPSLERRTPDQAYLNWLPQIAAA